ncbi:MAG: hypothetical protein ACYS1A_10365 [Planctomycetota bacterium]
MDTVKTLLFAGLAAMLALGGCAEEQQFKAIEQICVGGVSRAAAIEGVEDVLGQMHFAVEKADIESGYIRSRPLPGAQGFEFWRKDNIGAYNQMRANMHSIRRTVELDISPKNRELCISCDVKVEKLNLPEYAVSSSAQAYQMFSRSNLSRQTLEANPEQKEGMGWIDFGEDERLSTEILKQLKEKLSAESADKK